MRRFRVTFNTVDSFEMATVYIYANNWSEAQRIAEAQYGRDKLINVIEE
jgi:hypothetical protein